MLSSQPLIFKGEQGGCEGPLYTGHAFSFYSQHRAHWSTQPQTVTQQSELRLWLEANPAHILAERNPLTGKESRGVLRDQRGCGSSNTEP